MFKKMKFSFVALSALLIFYACGGGGTLDTSHADRVRVHALSDVEQINLINGSDAQTTIIGYQVKQALYGLHPTTYEFVPVLAKEKATIYEVNDTIYMDFVIREEALWDNGDPITGHDYAFSVKAVLNPRTDCVHLKTYYEFIHDVIVDDENPKKFTVVCKQPYMIAEAAAADLYMLPRYVYDPEGIMEQFTVKQLAYTTDELANDPEINRFANFFNSDRFKREVLAGSGPYRFERWDTNQRIVLQRKENWWGDKIDNTNNPWFQAYPNQIVYVTVNDLTTAVVALKGQSLDAMHNIPPKDFVEDLGRSQSFQQLYYMETPPLFSYDYIGINMRDPRLADVRVRTALAHMMNVEQLIEAELYGLGQRVTSFVHPSIKDRLNTEIEPYEFNLNKAREILAEAGWSDMTGDGILNKEIDGEMHTMRLRMFYNSGNQRRETTCLIFQNAARQAGLQIDIQALEWSVFLQRSNEKDFDLYVGGWVSSPSESDPAQIWHTRSYDGGSNYVGFGNDETDDLLDELRQTVDVAKRNKLYKELQQKIHDEVPYIFLLSQKNRVAVSRKYDNVFATGLRSGVWPAAYRAAAALTAE